MSETSIEWTDVTWNPVRGCTKISPGCKNCYAKTLAERFRGVPGHPFEQGFDLRLVPERLGEPLRWRKPRRVFVNSMSDLFHESISNEYIAAVFGVMAACPQHTFQVLTKRPVRMRDWFEWAGQQRRYSGTESSPAEVMQCIAIDRFHVKLSAVEERPWPLPNVWLGVSAEDQATADKRIIYLLETPAAVRFVSAEPLLGPIDFTWLDWLTPWLPKDRKPSPYDPTVRLNAFTGNIIGPDDMLDAKLDWIIVGGESGPGARPCELEWIRSIVRQCKEAGTKVFVKQLGAHSIARSEYDLGDDAYRAWDTEHAGEPFPREGIRARYRSRKGGDPSEWPEDLRIREWPEVRT